MAQATFNVLVSADDGTTEATGATYPPAGAPVASSGGANCFIVKKLSATVYTIDVALVRFDTSSLPNDATITAATLRVWVNTRADQDGRDLTMEWYDAGATIGAEDYTDVVGTNAHAGTSLSAITAGADRDFDLENVSNVSLTAYTGLRLHISGGAPTLINDLNFAAIDHATLPEPRLIVTYDHVSDNTLPAIQSRVPMPMMYVPDQDRIMRMHGRTLGS